MKSIDIIHGEHRALASALQPDFRLLASMVDYITQVPDKVHHPKEDNYLFPKMRPVTRSLLNTCRWPRAAAQPASRAPALRRCGTRTASRPSPTKTASAIAT